jgi:site-specific recombinase XerD
LKKIEDAYSPNILKAYRPDFLEFIEFCEEHGLPSLPANYESVALFVDANVDRGCSINFIRRKISVLASIHKFSRLPNPVLDIDVQLALRRMARKNGRINKQAYGLNKKLFDDLMQAAGDDIFGIRDKALL